MNTPELTIPASSIRTPQRFAQWFTTMYEELFKTNIEIHEIADLSHFKSTRFIEQIDKLICEQLPQSGKVQEIWENAGKKTLFVKSRKRELVDGRKLACVILREKKYTLSTIGLIMDQDHSTIIHSLQSAENLMETDFDFRRMYHNVKFALDYEKIIVCT
ncbi:MAG: hypothetical protein RLZZ382_1276 [Bacteroidota bacterium]